MALCTWKSGLNEGRILCIKMLDPNSFIFELGNTVLHVVHRETPSECEQVVKASLAKKQDVMEDQSEIMDTISEYHDYLHWLNMHRKINCALRQQVIQQKRLAQLKKKSE